MFGIGTTELIVILVVALIVVGPKKLPQIARTLGKAMGEFKKVSTDMHRTINTEIEREEQKSREKEESKKKSSEKKSKDKAPVQKSEEDKKAENAYQSAVAANTFPAEEEQGVADAKAPADDDAQSGTAAGQGTAADTETAAATATESTTDLAGEALDSTEKHAAHDNAHAATQTEAPKSPAGEKA